MRSRLPTAAIIESRSCPEPHTGCRLWSGSLHENGYGRVKVGGVKWYAHRAAWVAYRGAIPDGLMVLHSCDVRACVNPGHLYLGTHQDNMNDMTSRGRSAVGVRNAQHRHPERTARGERNGGATLREADAAAIYASRGTMRAIAASFGVSPSLVFKIKHRELWRHVTAT